MSAYNINEVEYAPTRKVVRWQPDFNAGNVGVILTICGGIFWFGGELKETRAGLIQVKADTIAESLRNKEIIGGVAADVKTIQTTVNDMRETLAVIRATQQTRGGEAKK